jgi:hypothetical protein
MIVGMCLVAGTAWAQSGPKASPKQVASPNQPQPTTANTNIATANSKKLKQPTFAARWTAVTTQQVIGQWFVTPINPNSAGAKLTKGSALLADIQSGPNGFYTFPAFTQDAPVNHYAQLELSVKPGRKYDIKCYTVMDWPRGYKTKVSLGEYVNGRAANVTPIDTARWIKTNTGSTPSSTPAPRPAPSTCASIAATRATPPLTTWSTTSSPRPSSAAMCARSAP